MERKSFEAMNCSVAQALEIVGEWWTMLIVREAFHGTRRFEAFQQILGISRNILATRLRRLVEAGILERRPVRPGARRTEYRLTDKGRDLFPVIIALLQWGDRWAPGDAGPPMLVVDRATGAEIAPLRVRAADGRALDARDARMVPGPAADAATGARLSEIEAD